MEPTHPGPSRLAASQRGKMSGSAVPEPGDVSTLPWVSYGRQMPKLPGGDSRYTSLGLITVSTLNSVGLKGNHLAVKRGDTVRVLQTHLGWAECEAANGQIGWVPSGYLQLVIPYSNTASQLVVPPEKHEPAAMREHGSYVYTGADGLLHEARQVSDDHMLQAYDSADVDASGTLSLDELRAHMRRENPMESALSFRVCFDVDELVARSKNARKCDSYIN